MRPSIANPLRYGLPLIALATLATTGERGVIAPATADLLDDTYEDTHRLEPPDDPDELPADPEPEGLDDSDEDTQPLAPEDPEPASGDAPSLPEEPDLEAPATGPENLDELDDTYEDTERLEPEGLEGEATEAPVQEQPAPEPAPTAPGAVVDADEPTEAQARAAWMHRYDQIGLYGVELPEDSTRLEGVYLHGYNGRIGGRQGIAGPVSIFSADLPLAADEDGLGEAYIGFGLQAGSERFTLYGTVGGVYARTVRSSGDSRSDTDWGADVGFKVALSERTMATLAVREDPNELIDDQTARLGLHFGEFYVGLRQRLDADLGRLDLAVRF